MTYNMKKNIILVIAVCFFVVAVPNLSPAADSNGVTRVGNIPGTNQNLFAIQGRRAQGRQLRDKAFSAELIRKPESVSDLVCLPKLNGNFASFGTLFSDVKESFNFGTDFSLDNLCKIAVGMNADLGGQLSGLMKVGAVGMLGLNLPVSDLCTGSVSLGGALSYDLSGAFNKGGSKTIDALGCAITVGLSIGGGFDVSADAGAMISIPSYCITLQVDAFKCQPISNFFGGPGIGAMLPIGGGGGANGGLMYATTDEEVTLAAGGNLDLKNALDAAGIESAIGAMAEVDLGIDFSFEASASSSDGLSADGGIAFGTGAAVKAGSGESFKQTYTTNYGKELFQNIKDDADKMEVAPEDSDGTIWQITPRISAGASASAVLDLMTLVEEADSSNTGSKTE